jgi:hypothetical protein
VDRHLRPNGMTRPPLDTSRTTPVAGAAISGGPWGAPQEDDGRIPKATPPQRSLPAHGICPKHPPERRTISRRAAQPPLPYLNQRPARVWGTPCSSLACL